MKAVVAFVILSLSYRSVSNADNDTANESKMNKKSFACVRPDMIEILKDGMSHIYQLKNG